MKRKIIDALDFKIWQQVSFKITPHSSSATISDACINTGIFSPMHCLILINGVGNINRYLYNFFLTDEFYLKIKTQTHRANNLYTKATRKEVEFSGFVLGKKEKEEFLELDFLFVGCSDIGKITFIGRNIYE